MTYKRWYKFPFPYAFSILYRRLNNRRPQPILSVKYKWQRAQRGWSEPDVWGFDYYLSGLIAEGVKRLREISHGHPAELTQEKWLQILTEIENGMNAAKAQSEDWEWPEGGEESFNLAMDHLKKWWFALWD